MCGLAGFARHPDGGDLDVLVSMFSDLIPAIEHRGKHATGVGVITPRGGVVRKWAIEPRKAVRTVAWDRAMDLITEDTTVVMGHVRHATLPNAKDDEAAHPFVFTNTIGAHNGQIYNWESIRREFIHDGRDWRTDSEAALYLLDRFDDPQKALDRVDGVWALTWVRRGLLYTVRTPERPLACAYVPDIKTLIWCSEIAVLRDVLGAHGFKRDQYRAWETQAGRLYRYDPLAFDEVGPHATERYCTFKARKAREKTKPVKVQRWNESWTAAPARNGKSAGRGSGRGAGRDSTLAGILTALRSQVDNLAGVVESLRAENDHLYDVLAEYGLLDGKPFPVAAPRAGSGACGAGATYSIPGQRGLFCDVCGEPETDSDPLVEELDGAIIHEGCKIPF